MKIVSTIFIPHNFLILISGFFKFTLENNFSIYLYCIFIKTYFSLFCFNCVEDGELSNKEFVAVMKNRLLRGLEKPKDTGFVKFIQSVVKCAKEEISNFQLTNAD